MSKVAFPVYVYGTLDGSAKHCKQAHTTIGQMKEARNLSLRFNNFKISHHPKEHLPGARARQPETRLQKLVDSESCKAVQTTHRTVRSHQSREFTANATV